MIDLAQGFKVNEKILDALSLATHPTTRVLTFEGTTRSAKTVTAIIAFHLLVQRMTAKLALIAAEDYNSIRTNLLESEFGLLTLYPDKYRLVSPPIGSKYIEAVTPNGLKEILLAGYSNKSKWKKILGKGIEVILIDEANIADRMFIDECYARQSATLHPVTIYTLNGDDPNHPIYQERINKSIIVGEAPASIQADMNRVKIKKRGYYYMHWSFKDNPILSWEQIRDLLTLYPIGSYYHKTKILGERGKWGTMIFADYMDPKKLIVNLKETNENGIPIYPVSRYTIGIDIAANRAKNEFVLVGFEKNFQYAGIVDFDEFDSKKNGRSVGYTYKTERLKAFLMKHQDILPLIDGGFVDSAEENYIKDLQAEKLPIAIAPSYKATIKKRIDLIILLYNSTRLLTDITCKPIFDAYQASTWVPGKEGKEREDNNLPMNDRMDATEYALTRHMNKLLAAIKRSG